MDALIDQVLNSILHAVIWRGVWQLNGPTLLVIGVVVFGVIAYRRR